MRKPTKPIVLALLASSLVIPSAALGWRTGSQSERTAILRAAGAFPRLPQRCNWVRITTVRPGVWAAVQSNNRRTVTDRGCRLAGQGTDFLRRTNGRWRVVLRGPTDPPYHVRGMPRAVTNDLTRGLRGLS
jgi:hypothetical protein